MSADHLASLLRSYGVEHVHRARRADSEADLTWLLDTSRGGLVVKESPVGHGGLEMQARLLEHVARRDPGLPVPRVLRPLGRADSAGEDERVLVMTRLPGEPLEDVAMTAGVVDAIVAAQARLLTALDEADPRAMGVPARNEWSIEALPECAGLLDDRRPAPVTDFLRGVLESFAAVVPLLDARPRQVLHADFNLSNLLFSGSGLSGILDFGDAVHAPRVLDVAVTATYLALHVGDLGHPLIVRYLDGIGERCRMNREELDLVPVLVRARLAMVLLKGRDAARRAPERAAYALRYDGHAVRLAHRLLTTTSTRPADR